MFGVDDAISGVVGLVGLGLSMSGSNQAAKKAQEIAQVEKQIFQVQKEENNVRREAMVMSSRRDQLEQIRNSQRARAMALNTAASQGAQFGSGLQGGYGQISGQIGGNLLNISGNLERGEKMFNFENAISDYRAQESQLKGEQAAAQGQASLGSSLFQASGTLGKIGSTGFSALGSFFK